MLLTAADVVLRIPYKPITGTVELVAFLNAIIVCFGLAYTQVLKGHMRVEFVVSKFSQRTQGIIDSVFYFASLGIYALRAWHSFVLGTDMWQSGEISRTLRIPFFPVVYGIAFCAVVLCLLLLIDLYNSVVQAVKK